MNIEHEKKILGDVITLMTDPNPDEDKVLETMQHAFYYAFVAYHKRIKKFPTENIRVNSINNEINLIKELRNNNIKNEDVNKYINIFLHYMYFRIQSSIVIKSYLLIVALKRTLSYSTIKTFLNSLKPYKDMSTEQLIDSVEKDAKNIRKEELKWLARDMSLMLSGELHNNKFLAALFEGLCEYQNFLSNELKIKPSIYEGRIATVQTGEEIASFLMKLNKINEREDEYLGKRILEKEDIEYLSRANFIECSPKESKKKIKANCSWQVLEYFFVEFYKNEIALKEDDECQMIEQKDYPTLLHCNFANFNGRKLPNIEKSFNKLYNTVSNTKKKKFDWIIK